MKRLLSVLLAVCMLFSMVAIVPVTASAETTDNITVYFTDALGWGDVHVYYWPNVGEWPGTAMDKDIVNDYGQQVYKAVIPANAEGIVFNGNGNQTVDIKDGIEDGAAWYTIDEKEGNNYKVEKVTPLDPAPVPETTVPETVAPESIAPEETIVSPEEGGFYISGTVSGWAPKAEFKLTKNDAAETEEYVFEGLELTTDDQFKVAYSEDGVSFKDTDWYPDGMGNNYGENGEITADGTYTVYFRPNVDGGDDWFYGCIYVAAPAPETTAPETAEPTTALETVAPETTAPETTAPETTAPETTAPETTAPETTAPAEGGFYISGTVSGWAPKAEFKLTKNDAADTEEYVFEGLELTTTDQFKIAYSEDGVSFKDTDWYPDGMGNNYGENGEITADGTYTVYFRPNVDGGDDWFYGCIYVAAPAPETTAPETTAPETTAPETTAPETTVPAEGGFYISGTVSGWAPKAEFKLTKNDAADTEEYVFEGLELTTTDQFKVAYSEDGVSFKDTDWYPDGMGNNYGENGEITADGTYTVYFRPNVDGGDDWFYGCIYVAAPAPETTAPETTAPETTAPETTAPAEGGFYIAGTVSGWAPKAEFKLTKNDAAETEEYVFEGLELTTTDQFKIAYSEDGVSFKDTDWYPDGMGNNYGENGEITADGTYTVYFRPNVDGGDDWFYGCIYVAEAAVETTAPETTAPETTAPETTAPAEGGFYIAGTVSGWAPKAEFKLTKNDAADTEEYVFEGLELTTTDQFKIAYSEDGVSFKDTDWYPDGMGNNYGENGEITADGTYTVYFRPNVDGGDDWFYGCIYVAAPAPETTPVETTPEETTPVETTPEETTPAEEKAIAKLPNVDDVVAEAGITDTFTVYFQMPDGNLKFDGTDGSVGTWENDYNELNGQNYAGIYWWQGAKPLDPWPGAKMTLVDAEQNIYSANVPFEEDVLTTIIFNNAVDGGTDKTTDIYKAAHQTANINCQGYDEGESDIMPEGTPKANFDGCIFILDSDTYSINKFSQKDTIDGDWYFYYGDGHYGHYAKDSDNFVSIEENCCNPNHDHGHQPETTAPETTAPETTAPEAGDYYIVGNMTDWAPNAAYKMTKNESADTEEYMFNIDLTTDSQFKVVYVEGEKQTWIPDGMGNNYGENGEITADGTYTVYFRPNADGGDDWFYGCIYVAEAAIETTAPETTAPETTAPAEGGFYISGTVSGWAPKAEFKLTKNDAAETEEYVFEGLELTTTDQFKIAYSEDGVSFKDTDWYPDGMGNNYGENGEITADGTYTVYFRPNVDGGDDWFYGCIYVAAPAPETTAPETTAPETTAPETTAPETTAPAEGGFYISGTVSGWAPKAEFKLTKNEAAEAEEYVFEGLELTTTDQFKIAYSEDGVSFKDTDWYPDGMGNNYGENGEITADGTYTVYFRPNVDGGDDWFYGCIYVAAPAPETTAPETTALETTAPETTAPETTAPAEGGFYISGTVSGWAPKAEFKLTKNDAADTEEYVFEGLELTTTDQFKIAYSEDGVSFKDTDWYPDGMGNNYGENGEITADGTYTVYFRPNVDGGDDWFYGCIYVAAPAPETTAPVTDGGFYVVGTMNSWALVAEYKLTQNALGWYQLNGLELKTTDRFKVAYSADGVSFKDAVWYPDGLGNNYGENGEITVDGTYTLFFDPTVSGGSEWFYGCIFIDMPDPADMFLLGDADGSDEVDAVDATVVQRAATLVKVPYAEDILMQGDVDDDGELTVIDATFILRYSSLAPTPYRIGEYVSR